MADSQSKKASGLAKLKQKSVEEYALEYQQMMDEEMPACLGFSARLNMLWDLAGAAPPQIEGRVRPAKVVTKRCAAPAAGVAQYGEIFSGTITG